MSYEIVCCLEHCCILDGCKCREYKRIVLYCCLAEGNGIPHYPLCNDPGGCKSEEFTCLHICCSLRDGGCCNPCYKPGGCREGTEDGSLVNYDCCENQIPWSELLNQ